LAEINGVFLADCLADSAFLLLQVKATFIDISDERYGLREIYMDGFIRRQVLIVGIRNLNRAVLDTGRATRASVLDNVSGLLIQGDLEVSCCAFDLLDFSKGENLYIRMPADLDQFGREDSHGAVIRGVGLVKLGHMSADGRCFLDQINPKTGCGKIKRGLNPADASADHHDVSEV
jgi:hypothetical protein